MTPTRIQEIRAALHARADDGRTHWNGCEVQRDHRDCAIARLLGEWDTRDTALRSLVQQLDERARERRVFADDWQCMYSSGEAAGLARAAEMLARLLTSEDH